MSERVRDNGGKFVETVTPERVLEIMRETDAPIATARDIADVIGCTPEAVMQKLKLLHEQERVDRRKVGSRAVVWWLTEDQSLDTNGRHNPDEPFFADAPLDHGEPIDVADTDEILGDALEE